MTRWLKINSITPNTVTGTNTSNVCLIRADQRLNPVLYWCLWISVHLFLVSRSGCYSFRVVHQVEVHSWNFKANSTEHFPWISLWNLFLGGLLTMGYFLKSAPPPFSPGCAVINFCRRNSRYWAVAKRAARKTTNPSSQVTAILCDADDDADDADDGDDGG